MLTRHLRSLGYQVTDVTGDHQPKDTLAAVDLFLVEKALAETFKSVLLDIKQKASQKLSMTPMLIGLPAKDDPSPWLKAGFDDVIQLPFHKELLATRLEVWLRIREESRLGLRTLYENATLGLYRTTPNGEILLANPALVAMLGYDSLKELQKRNLETEGFEPGYDRTAFRHRLEREGVIRGLEAVWYRKDGSAIYIRESARVIRDASGNILFYEGTVEDITERKRAEETLKESERMFRDLYESAPNAYLSVSVKGRILRCNPRAGELLGYPVDQLVGRPVLDLYADTPCGKAKAKQVLKRFKAGEVVQNEELQMQKADGTPIWISLTVNAIKDGQGRVVESRSMAVDITERKRVEERVKRRDALLTAVSFSAGRLLAATSWKDMATEVLAQVGNATEVSRIYLFENHRDPSGTFLTSQRFEWVNEGITPQIDSPELQNFPWIEAGFGRWCELMEKGDYVCGLVKDFPRSERVVLEAQDIKSILALPITVEKRFWGFIGFDECNFEREWSPTEINVLFTLTGLFGSAIERELDEQILRESQQQYQNIFEYSSDAIFIHDLQGNIIDVNQKTLSLFGYKKTEILKRNVSELHPAHAQKKSREAFKTIMRDKSVNFEIEFLKKNGDSFPAEVSSTIIKLEGQDVVLGIVRDITERKEMENTLRANEEKYRGIFDESVAAIYLFDVNMHFIASNQAGLDLLGYSREELLKMSISDVDADPKEVLPAHKQLLTGERIVNYEHKLKRKDGRIITVLNNSRPILNNEGVVIGLQSTLLDITARKEAEKALKQTIQEMKAVNSVIRQVNRSLTYENVVQSSLKAIFTTIQPDLVLVFLREGDKLFFQGEIYNDPHFRHNKTPVHKVGQYLCGLAVKENKAMYSIDITKDSRCTWVECKEAGFRSFAALPLRSAEEIIGVLGLASINKRDFSQQQTTLDTLSHEIAISLQNSIFYRQLKEHATELEKEVAERKLAEDKIQKSLQEKEVLLKEIHHRVKNNLQVISSLLNLQAEGFKDRNIRSLFGESRDRIRSMALVHESLYKSEDYSQVNFGEYLENLVRQLFRLYQQSDVDLEMKVAPIRLPMDLAIPCGLVVNELVTNALKHAFPSGQAGKITVSFQKEGSRSLVLEVEDDGVGIHEETIPGESGSLGMNLVSILVEDQLRGTLKVRQDGGTHVKILFPWRAGSK